MDELVAPTPLLPHGADQPEVLQPREHTLHCLTVEPGLCDEAGQVLRDCGPLGAHQSLENRARRAPVALAQLCEREVQPLAQHPLGPMELLVELGGERRAADGARLVHAVHDDLQVSRQDAAIIQVRRQPLRQLDLRIAVEGRPRLQYRVNGIALTQPAQPHHGVQRLGPILPQVQHVCQEVLTDSHAQAPLVSQSLCAFGHDLPKAPARPRSPPNDTMLEPVNHDDDAGLRQLRRLDHRIDEAVGLESLLGHPAPVVKRRLHRQPRVLNGVTDAAHDDRNTLGPRVALLLVIDHLGGDTRAQERRLPDTVGTTEDAHGVRGDELLEGVRLGATPIEQVGVLHAEPVQIAVRPAGQHSEVLPAVGAASALPVEPVVELGEKLVEGARLATEEVARRTTPLEQRRHFRLVGVELGRRRGVDPELVVPLLAFDRYDVVRPVDAAPVRRDQLQELTVTGGVGGPDQGRVHGVCEALGHRGESFGKLVRSQGDEPLLEVAAHLDECDAGRFLDGQSSLLRIGDPHAQDVVVPLRLQPLL